LARIELGPAEIPKFLEEGTVARVGELLRKLGYAHVTLDLAGYRRGSLNAALRPDTTIEVSAKHRQPTDANRNFQPIQV
jgi:PP-loop superfamily ATP-utilizing enzyme